MYRELTPVSDQLERLRVRGEQFAPEERNTAHIPLPGVYMELDGEPTMYDVRIVPYIPSMVVPATMACQALKRVRGERSTTQDAASLIGRLQSASGMTIGFSGYGTEGDYGYASESDGIEAVFAESEAARLPINYVISGGTGYGVPGLGGLHAAMREYPTIGCAPLRGLRGVAPCDELVVVGEEFGDEANVLGTSPDMLFVLGGGPIAEMEMQAAMRMGSKIVLLTLKSYPKNSVAYVHQRHPVAYEAWRNGDLVTCDSTNELGEFLKTLTLAELKANRNRRAAYLGRALRVSP